MAAHSDDSIIEPQKVEALRTFSRQLVRELGYLRSPLARSDLTPSAVHAIIEIGLQPGIQARDLASILRLDKSNTSRQIAKLEADGCIERVPIAGDARAFGLLLTPAGEALRHKIDAFGSQQVARVLMRLDSVDQQALLRFLSLYATALNQNDAHGFDADAAPSGDIGDGFVHGLVGDVVGLYSRTHGRAKKLGAAFEARVAAELGAFVAALPAAGKNMWHYCEGGRILGAIALDGDPATGQAVVRWFIVHPYLRNSGIGRQLLEHALAFADRHVEHTCISLPSHSDPHVHQLCESVGFMPRSPGKRGRTVPDDLRFERVRPQPEVAV